jgi:Flp pilus assembly protein TadG
MRHQAGGTLLEFAIAWPVALLLVAGSVQLAVWGSQAYAAKQAALAGARAGSTVGGSTSIAGAVALASLQPVLPGTAASSWCPASRTPQPPVWVCATGSTTTVEVRVGGSAPAILPFLTGGRGLPLNADVSLVREAFR